MNKKPFMRPIFFSLALIFIDFCGYISSCVAMKGEDENRLYLSRANNSNETILEYTDNIKVANPNFMYNLNYPIDRELARKAYDYGQEEPFKYGLPNPKSHMLVNSFDIYQKGEKTFIEYEPLTTKTFHQVGIGEKNTDIKIDWMSNLSQLDDEGDVVRCMSNKGIPYLNAGHSEPQLIYDVKELFKTSKKDVVNFFIPRPNKRENSTVLMYGLELYGTFDICDTCLDQMVKFRKWGQKNISPTIEKELKYSINSANSFVIIYHTLKPYAAAKYKMNNNQNGYEIHYNPDEKQDKKGCIAFGINKEPNKIGDLVDTTLSQKDQITTTENVIYGQIHGLYNKKGVYRASVWQDYFKPVYKFAFDGQDK